MTESPLFAPKWPAAASPVLDPVSVARQPQLEKIKILHVITRFRDGSGGNTLMTLLGADQARYDLWVAASRGGPLWERAASSGVRTVQLGHLREKIAPLDDLVTLFQLARLIRRERFTIVHTHSSKAGILGRLAAWLCRTPVIVHTIHGFAWHDFMSPRRRSIYIALERLARPMTHAFFAVSPQVATEAVRVGMARSTNVLVVPSAVALDEIPDGSDPLMRAVLGIPADVPVVGTVGRLDFQKAPLDFVRMAASIKTSHPEARFVWVGEGLLLEEAQAEARRLGVEVIFTGFRDDAARVASSFDVFVISSLYEGLGRALSEAMASGRPVVATAVNGVVDIVEPRVTGLLAPPADPEALASQVVWLLENPDSARRMGEAGRKRARSLFDPAVMCGLIEQAYARLLRPTVRAGASSTAGSAGDRSRSPLELD